MANVRLTCPCGHVWEQPASDQIPADLRQICPVCSPVPPSLRGPSPQPPASGSSTIVAIDARPQSVRADSHRAATAPNADGSARAAAPAASSGDPAVMIGKVVAGFELLEELNRGGMGVIYKAKQLAMNRIVALKAIIPAKLERPGVRQRFMAEVKASALLNHPNIVMVYHTDLDGPFPYLAMEYVPGIDLLRLVRKHGAVPVTDAVYYIRQAVEGLQHAHEQGLIHRDVKPSNLMVSPGPLTVDGQKSGKVPRLKILDMGLARVIGPDGTDSTEGLIEAGVFLGTPDYVAPEQAEDCRKADARSDIFSLGASLYFLLTAEVPFPGKTLVEKIRRAVSEPPPSPAAKRKDVPAALDAIVRKMLASDPGQRYQSAAEVVQALDRLLRGDGGPLSSAAPIFVEPPAPTPLARVKAHEAAIRGLVVTAEDPKVITAGEDSRLRLWEPTRLTEINSFLGDFGAVEHLALAPNGKRVATCATRLTPSEMGVQLWDLTSGAAQRTLRGPAANVRCVAISPDSKAIAGGADDHLVWVWMAEAQGPKTFCMRGHSNSVTGVWFVSADSLLSAGADGIVRQWDLRSGKTKGTLSAGVGPIAALAYGGKRLAVAGEGLAVRQPTGAFVRLPGHAGNVLCVAFSPDGRLLASGGTDKTLRVWSTEEAKELACYPHASPVRSVAFAPDGRALFTGDTHGTLSRWAVPVI